ncbi:MAG: UbiA family prenyltransferase, partial [Bacteroidetes bacterium]|nr:UbiA family prenyltransferase [Bacteroidota bacterium]
MQTQPIISPVAIPSIAFIRAYVITMRPYLLFVSGITVLAGLATGNPGIAVIVVTGTAGFLSYGFGQALTDCFQTDTDALSSPYRPLVKGLVTPRQVGIVSLVGLAAVAAGLAWFNPHNLWLATVGAIGLATYTPFKRRWATGYNTFPVRFGWIAAAIVSDVFATLAV